MWWEHGAWRRPEPTSNFERKRRSKEMAAQLPPQHSPAKTSERNKSAILRLLSYGGLEIERNFIRCSSEMT